MTHTPGPWRIDPDATFIGEHYVGTDHADIALMADWSLDLEPEQWANARLIAAAPELLAFAQAYLERLDDGSPVDTSFVAQMARQSIAKALGLAA